MSDSDDNFEKPQPLKRTFTSVERDTIAKAIAAINEQGEGYKRKGLSPSSFFFGVINVFVTGFILGKAPEHYWIFQLVKCSFYVGYMWVYRIKEKQGQNVLYMIEFCWFAVHLYMVFLTIAVLAATQMIEPGIFGRKAFLAYWGMANGPLAAAAFLLGNSLVFHDIPNLASCFIHLTPCSSTWTMRWYSDRMNEQWPDIFIIPDPHEINEQFLEVVAPAIALYMIWWVLYFLYFLLKGRYLGIPHSKYDTTYHETMRGNKAAAMLCGYDPDKYADVGCLTKYMVYHLIGTCSLISFSYLLWFNYWIHTLFCSSLFMFCTYNGAQRYYNMMTKYYRKSLEKIAMD